MGYCSGGVEEKGDRTVEIQIGRLTDQLVGTQTESPYQMTASTGRSAWGCPGTPRGRTWCDE